MLKKGLEKQHTYIAIDLKSFYASVECVERALDAMSTNLVVADTSRTEKTICLAVSPAMKSYGIPGRARLFEVIQKVNEANAVRRSKAPNRVFTGVSYDAKELKQNKSLSIAYYAVVPRMSLYMEYSTKIYQIYLRFVAPEDIHVYSIDEILFDATSYLNTYQVTAGELVRRMIQEVYEETGITATAGIGTNLYLCKIAMDIVAKHVEADENGVRVAELDEQSYRQLLWSHQPLTDFWQVGRGYAKKLEQCGLMTMGDIARCSLGTQKDYYNEELLYRMFGVKAELLIDHAWGYEPCTIADIKAYQPENKSICSGQVLMRPYSAQEAKVVIQEMTEGLVLDLVHKKLQTDQIVLTIGYDIESLQRPEIADKYHGETTIDRYGREIPKHAHGTVNLSGFTASTKEITTKVQQLYDRIIYPALLVRRIQLTANHIIAEEHKMKEEYEQLHVFSFLEEEKGEEKKQELSREREKKMQQAVLEIKKKYGKNAILKGSNLIEGSTAIQRNSQIGGHKA